MSTPQRFDLFSRDGALRGDELRRLARQVEGASPLHFGGSFTQSGAGEAMAPPPFPREFALYDTQTLYWIRPSYHANYLPLKTVQSTSAGWFRPETGDPYSLYAPWDGWYYVSAHVGFAAPSSAAYGVAGEAVCSVTVLVGGPPGQPGGGPGPLIYHNALRVGNGEEYTWVTVPPELIYLRKDRYVFLSVYTNGATFGDAPPYQAAVVNLWRFRLVYWGDFPPENITGTVSPFSYAAGPIDLR